MEHCATKGFLSFLVLWLVSKQKMTGAEISSELEKRRGKKPSTLTENGKKSLDAHLDLFINTFYDIDEMKSCCCKSRKSE